MHRRGAATIRTVPVVFVERDVEGCGEKANWGLGRAGLKARPSKASQQFSRSPLA